MGRPSKSRTLDLWAHGVRVGRWGLPAQGLMELRYDPRWMGSEAGRPLGYDRIEGDAPDEAQVEAHLLFHEPVAVAILQGLQDSAQRLERMPAE